MTSAMRINKVAVFVDGENITADHAAEIDRISRELGDAVIRRVYGNAQRIAKWDATPGYRVIHSGSGKNATDMLIAIDVMELLPSETFDTIMIASSDRDFTHLALRLRERMLRVIGAGDAKAPEAFRSACSQFKTLGAGVVKVAAPPVAVVPPAAKPVASPPKKPQPTPPADLDNNLRALIERNDTAGRGMPLVDLGNKMRNVHKIATKGLPNSTWRAYLVSKPNLYDLDPKGKSACVRLRPAGI